ncbi:MAG TPA: methyltransferase domain-containing protein [Streptosporangiaceae bacterium]|nr:methyltransferase domain-containing protein [Streptosporangiaceae bacterium]
MTNAPTSGPHADEEHARIRSVYEFYDRDKREQRKRDSTNPGVRLNSEGRLAAILGIMQRLNLKEGFRLLDVGCGNGTDLRYISAEFSCLHPRLHGVDILDRRIGIARRQVPSATIQKSGAEALPFEDCCFDVVLASTIFSSILSSQITRAAAAEIARVVTSGGTILCYDTRYPNPSNPHTRPIRPRELKRLFPDASVVLTPITLLPPVARHLGAFTHSLYRPLHALAPLRSHYLAVIRPDHLTVQASSQLAPGSRGGRH